jgi:hypothetical protein
MSETIESPFEAFVIGKYLEAREWSKLSPTHKTRRWGIYSTAHLDRDEGSLLGFVAWFGRWRQYTFDPKPGTTFNRGCLADITAFLEKVNLEHRKERKRDP